jgi:hypothetical protein
MNMGGCTFSTFGRGKTARDAFEQTVAEARFTYGHGGYTGTIAEKTKFTLIPKPAEIRDIQDRKELCRAANEYARHLIDECDPRVDHTWGPAGCIDLGEGEYLFFGWASS